MKILSLLILLNGVFWASPSKSIEIYDVHCPDDNEAAKSALKNQRNFKYCSFIDANYPQQKPKIDALYHEFAWNAFDTLLEEKNFPDNATWRKQPTYVPTECKSYSEKSFLPFVKPTWHYTDELPVNLPMPAPHNPIWDQAGNQVVLEAYLNDEIVQHYQNGKLNALDDAFSQFKLYTSSTNTIFIKNWQTEQSNGPLSIKLAWKKMTKEDNSSQYFTKTIGDNNELYGLVAFHIGAKLASANNYWVWATFGHIYNLEGPNPSFRNPNCDVQTCPPNTCPSVVNGQRKTQISRVNPIPQDIQAFNKTMQEQPNRATSVTRFYQLIGVQRPFNAWGFKANLSNQLEPFNSPDFSQKVAVPDTKILASEIIEWDRQKNSSCMSCHSTAVTWTNLNQPTSPLKSCNNLEHTQVSPLSRDKQRTIVKNIRYGVCEYENSNKTLSLNGFNNSFQCIALKTSDEATQKCPPVLFLNRGWVGQDTKYNPDPLLFHTPGSDLIWSLYDAEPIKN